MEPAASDTRAPRARLTLSLVLGLALGFLHPSMGTAATPQGGHCVARATFAYVRGSVLADQRRFVSIQGRIRALRSLHPRGKRSCFRYETFGCPTCEGFCARPCHFAAHTGTRRRDHARAEPPRRVP